MAYKVYKVTGNYSSRQKQANTLGVALYLEAHYNSTPGAQGTEICITREAGKLTRAIAGELGPAIAKFWGIPARHNNTGVKILNPSGENSRGYGNLAYTNMPAILLEPCFIDDKVWADRAKNEGKALARVIYGVIRKHIPDGSGIALSLGHRGKTSDPNDRGALGGNGIWEADLAQIYLQELYDLLTAEPGNVPAEPVASPVCPPWAQEAREWGLRLELTTTDTGWNQPMTKAEVFTVLHRLLGNQFP